MATAVFFLEGGGGAGFLAKGGGGGLALAPKPPGGFPNPPPIGALGDGADEYDDAPVDDPPALCSNSLTFSSKLLTCSSAL